MWRVASPYRDAHRHATPQLAAGCPNHSPCLRTTTELLATSPHTPSRSTSLSQQAGCDDEQGSN